METFLGSIPPEVELAISIALLASVAVVAARRRRKLLAEQAEEGHGSEATRALTWRLTLMFILFLLIVVWDISELI